MIELFAGDAGASRSCKMGGLATAMLDIRYSVGRARAFDMSSSSGFALLGFYDYIFNLTLLEVGDLDHLERGATVPLPHRRRVHEL